MFHKEGQKIIFISLILVGGLFLLIDFIEITLVNQNSTDWLTGFLYIDSAIFQKSEAAYTAQRHTCYITC